MSFDFDEDILHDFLVEAGEILEHLYEKLVELENNINDKSLLNAIFRGFHTIKGGAGFLNLLPLVDLCHIAENVFDDLRNGKIVVSPALMDVVLQATDSIKTMFDAIIKREYPQSADPALLEKLRGLVERNVDQSPPLVIEKQTKVDTTIKKKKLEKKQDGINEIKNDSSGSDIITEQEFEQILNELHGSKNIKTDSKKNDSWKNSEITDDEFERLLDELHGPIKTKKADSCVNKNSKKESEIKFSTTYEKVTIDNTSSKNNLNPSSVPLTAVSTTAVTNKEPAKEVAETTVRVDTKRLDDIMNMVGELVLVRNRLVRLCLKSVDEAMAKAVANLDVVTADLQMSVMKTRMQPIKKVFGRFPRVVRDLARSLNKEVLLELKGEETDLDKNLVEALSDPLVHLVRNSVDHGIENPERRVAAGKNRAGLVVLSAEQEGDHILLTITDDGAGIDPQLLKRKAVEKGVIDQDAADRLSESETFNLIFHPGFSTKDQISDVSGRGVGMDVVKTKITQLNGSIQVKSELGKGSIIAIKVPLTLAIMPTLMVMLANQTFALPLVSVNEIFHLNVNETNEVDGQEVVIVREQALPLFRLRSWLIKPQYQQINPSCHVVIVSVGTRKVGFLVDKLIGQEEVVIKPLGKMLHGTPGMAGATITGDGSIALILDVPSLLKQYAKVANRKPQYLELDLAS